LVVVREQGGTEAAVDLLSSLQARPDRREVSLGELVSAVRAARGDEGPASPRPEPSPVDPGLIISSPGRVRFSDPPSERHGDFVGTRAEHVLDLPSRYRVSVFEVTNDAFARFISARGYAEDAFWESTPFAKDRGQLVSMDHRSLGPSTWPSEDRIPPGREKDPVSGISYYEALAFVAWLNAAHPVLEPAWPGWRWMLPTEDMWELAARG